MLTDEERQIVEHGKASGKSKQEVINALAKYRQGAPVQATADTSEKKPGLFSSQGAIGKAARKVTDFLGGGAIADTYGAEIAKLGATEDEKRFISQPSERETSASALKFGSTFLGGAGAGANLAKLAAYGGAAGYLYDIGQKIEDGREEDRSPGMGTAVGFVTGPLGGKGVNQGGKFVKEGAEAAADAAGEIGKVVSNSPVVRGAFQMGTEFAERVPRFVSNKAADIRDAATRAERIETAPKPVGNALKAGVDERIINTIEQADEPTRKGFADIVRLAEESIDTSGTLKTTARPEIVAGDAAAEQYKLIDQQKRKVGKAIGDAVKNLSKDVEVPMQESYDNLDEALRELGVDVINDEGDRVLNFAKTGFTKAQRAKIKELYDLATEGGDTLTPAQIHAKDRIFSQLSREARMEGIGDLVVETQDGPVSLFRIFRDVYSDTLEQVAPEIKPLNKQYRNLSTFTEDIEKSIIKGGKFETNSNLDPAEFAQTNLRRLFSEAQSAADYRAIAEEMDAASRALGYEGATPSDLARFAYEIRKIYPESTPRTGFEGSIKSVGEFVGHVLDAGTPDLSDQQKALRELIDAMTQAQE